jgi:two-component system sensor histidine kinase DegS
LESRHLTGATFNFSKPESPLNLSSEYSLLIYRVVQELLTNMAKHAAAKNVEIVLNKNNNFVELFYRDDGSGFDLGQADKMTLRRKEDKFRLGLLGLKERVEVLDGQMPINSVLGKGTTIIVRLPI